MSSCFPVSDTAWAWGTCGVSRTSVTGMEEVSPCKSVSCSLKSLRAHRALVSEVIKLVCGNLLHQFRQEAHSAPPLGVRCTAATTSPSEAQAKSSC